MRLKRVLFALLLAALCLPALQAKFRLLPERPLEGWFVVAPHPDLAWEALRANQYQPKLEAYLQERLGFRPFLVRLNYQLAYSAFDVIRAKALVRGENDVLFQDWPIDSYYGRDYVGDAPIRQWVRKLKVIQDSLTQRGVLFVFAIAPNKVAYYPEYIPAAWRGPQHPTNYATTVREMQRQGIHLLDLAAWFRQLKDSAEYPLFPRGGTHWSGYGTTLAADTLLRYLEHHGQFDMPNYRVSGIDFADTTRGYDADIATALNLLVKPRPFRMAYPRVDFAEPQPGQKKPNVLIIGDSFVWSFLDFYDYFPRLFNSQSAFWYYHRRVGWPGVAPLIQFADRGADISLLDRKAELERRDVVLVLYAEYNLNQFDHGFTQSTYPFYEHLSPKAIARLDTLKREIRANWDVMARLHREATARGLSLETHLHQTALDQLAAEQ